MAFPALKTIFAMLFLLLVPVWASACFGPKLFIGSAAGEAGELHYHLVAIYLHEKTGIDSMRVEFSADETAQNAINAGRVDLGFGTQIKNDPPVLLHLEDRLLLFSGKRPLEDLQFSTVQRALQKLQKRLEGTNLTPLYEQTSQGILPATAVRNFMLKQGWI